MLASKRHLLLVLSNTKHLTHSTSTADTTPPPKWSAFRASGRRRNFGCAGRRPQCVVIHSCESYRLRHSHRLNEVVEPPNSVYSAPLDFGRGTCHMAVDFAEKSTTRRREEGRPSACMRNSTRGSCIVYSLEASCTRLLNQILRAAARVRPSLPYLEMAIQTLRTSSSRARAFSTSFGRCCA